MFIMLNNAYIKIKQTSYMQIYIWFLNVWHFSLNLVFQVGGSEPVRASVGMTDVDVRTKDGNILL